MCVQQQALICPVQLAELGNGIISAAEVFTAHHDHPRCCYKVGGTSGLDFRAQDRMLYCGNYPWQQAFKTPGNDGSTGSWKNLEGKSAWIFREMMLLCDITSAGFNSISPLVVRDMGGKSIKSNSDVFHYNMVQLIAKYCIMGNFSGH